MQGAGGASVGAGVVGICHRCMCICMVCVSVSVSVSVGVGLLGLLGLVLGLLV